MRRFIAGILFAQVVLPVLGQDAPAPLEKRFHDEVLPFLNTYCLSCHGVEKPKGDMDLSPFKTVESVAKDHLRWEIVLERLRAGDMPPEKAKVKPTDEARKRVIDWVVGVREFEAKRNAGDPGVVLARRLSNAEYDYTIRDLTGVDIRPTKEFPVDPANEAGFDNTGESLTMSPALLKKYLEAARKVADHLVLEPEGFAFAPHPVIADTDRDKYCVNRIIDFYKRQKTDYADYFVAAWTYKNRVALGKPAATLTEIAGEKGISLKYLATVWATLEEGREDVGPIAALRVMWGELPKGKADETDVRAAAEKMRDFVGDLRKKLVPTVRNLNSPGVHNGSQPLVMWKNRQFAANRRKYSGGALQLKDLKLPEGSPAAQVMAAPTAEAAQERFEATFDRFCSVFPDAFLVSERARVYLDPEKEKDLTGRLLNAGFHSQGGYFRDDYPLYELMLSPAEQRELDGLWKELDFVTSAPMRQHYGLLWFDRTDSRYMRDPEFDPYRPEDKDSSSEAKIKGLTEVYLAKTARMGASETALQAIRDHFREINGAIRWVEKARWDAEPSHVKALQDFAERAYRRKLSESEREGVAAFYRSLREKDGLNHEEAVRDTLVGVLMSPHFCYRVDLPGKGEGERRPLNDHALASRLSYFLWGSMPDRELLGRAAAGDLHKPEVLTAQAKRMLRDPRVRGFVTEFGGNWLDFRRFEEHNAVDRERFAGFTNELRQAMFEEPIRFMLDVAQNDRSVLDFLYGKHTFVNGALAKHYGMPDSVASSDWVRVEDATPFGRGGLLPMGVFLTKNAPGLRTSPVKRGYWVARRVLGEHIPPPPPDVPELPADESKLGELSLRETLEKHRADPNCATCHEKFDSLGLVFEGYGPVGERREKDLGGKAVDTRANFPGGGEGSGLDGLKQYVREKRQNDFVENLCRKMLANALGRTLLLSDEETVQRMRSNLEKNGYRFSAMVETIVTSPQFLNKRAELVMNASNTEGAR